jgi:hypothetical protein
MEGALPSVVSGLVEADEVNRSRRDRLSDHAG